MHALLTTSVASLFVIINTSEPVYKLNMLNMHVMMPKQQSRQNSLFNNS